MSCRVITKFVRNRLKNWYLGWFRRRLRCRKALYSKTENLWNIQWTNKINISIRVEIDGVADGRTDGQTDRRTKLGKLLLIFSIQFRDSPLKIIKICKVILKLPKNLNLVIFFVYHLKKFVFFVFLITKTSGIPASLFSRLSFSFSMWYLLVSKRYQKGTKYYR